ncbi:MAG: nicotinate-nucleotide--dimethylbenzimidazole phosphoribosyltransferase [Gemmatimonadaceae bacterium]|jgi:nicotinate-nucleotide--dimethylbenzimidazole phosphoribosyltransferase|nr:nicotinate-nucleotide--dimethylbenzimidazole phosphoribosyltransferase [Gemmatimonadaceae bacterium]
MMDWSALAWRALDEKTKPPRSLGELESLAVRLSGIQHTLAPRVDRARIAVFAADHGVTAEGVSAYPAEVTMQMVRNFLRSGAAVSALAAANGIEVEVIDVGVVDDVRQRDPEATQLGVAFHAPRIRAGAGNIRREAAMSADECGAAMAVGAATVARAAADGVQVLGLGEMGIGNTTASAAVLAALLELDAALVVGRGTGIDDDGLAHKAMVVRDALARHHVAYEGARHTASPLDVLASLGGLELAAITGAVLAAPQHGVAVIADGFISTVAALVAVRANPPAIGHLFVAHRSAERGHTHALAALEVPPILDLGMRLGEGSGTALAIPILRGAAAILREMATFASADVSPELGART